MGKRFKRLFLLSIITVFLAIPAIYAYMFMQDQVNNNNFVIADVTCKINEVLENNQKKSISVENVGNVDTYIRVTLITYWEDSKEQANTVGYPIPKVSFAHNEEHWIKTTTDEGLDVYYYKYPVKSNPGTSNENVTKDLLADGSVIQLAKRLETSTDGVPYEYYQAVEVHAESIQANPPKAVFEAWGAVVDSSGYITSIN